MHHAVFAGFNLAGIDRHRAARIDDDDAALLDRLRTELGFLLGHRGSAQIRNPVIEEVIGLGFERVGADGHDGVSKFSVFVAIVKFTDAHVARGVNFRIICRAIVDADVLDLHGAEIELSSAPGVFIATASAAMIERRNE